MKAKKLLFGLSIFLFFNFNLIAQHSYIGVWEGSTWCSNPSSQAKSFKLTVWSENGVLRCSDHSGSNIFKPCIINNKGQLVCSWYRNNSSANGTYVFYFENGNPNILGGFENTSGISCKQYRYKLNRKGNNNSLNRFVGNWRGDTWCVNPGGGKSHFKFDIWMENGQLRCSDHSGSNKFHPCTLTNDGKIICNWYRTNSDAKGSYVFYLDKNNPNVLHGYENTQGVRCKVYNYRLTR